MGRIDDPAEHILLVHGLHPAFFHLTECEVVVEILVLVGKLFCGGLLLAKLQTIHLVSLAHAVALGVEGLAISG